MPLLKLNDLHSRNAIVSDLSRSQWCKTVVLSRWKPRRSIILASWDAEEFNLGGSVEWGEDNQMLLSQRAVAYLNVDVGASGPGFWGSATPTLDHLLYYVTNHVRERMC